VLTLFILLTSDWPSYDCIEVCVETYMYYAIHRSHTTYKHANTGRLAGTTVRHWLAAQY